MFELDVDLEQDQRGVYVQEEPALEIALPQVFVQPELTAFQRGKLPDVESLAYRIARRHLAHPEEPLGPDYQELVTEFQPLFLWATASWDYLLSTEGCRFVLRRGEQKFGARGDYRAFTDKDFSRLLHGIFRACILEFLHHPTLANEPLDAASPCSGRVPSLSRDGSNALCNGGPSTQPPSLGRWLRAQLWPRTLEAYRRLDQPPDPRQRSLTPYSYLRCVPYQFLNEFHHDLVYATSRRLPDREWQAIDAYFLHFFTEAASADALGCGIDECVTVLHQGLRKLLIRDRLVYCLLRQIERY